MLCFKDMAFCESDCSNEACVRHFGDDDHEEAIKWWGGQDAPIQFCDFTEMCGLYEPPKQEAVK